MEGDFLGEEGGADAADGSSGTDHGGAIFLAKRGGGIEGEGGLAAFELDRGLGKKRGEGALMGGVTAALLGLSPGLELSYFTNRLYYYTTLNYFNNIQIYL